MGYIILIILYMFYLVYKLIEHMKYLKTNKTAYTIFIIGLLITIGGIGIFDYFSKVNYLDTKKEEIKVVIKKCTIKNLDESVNIIDEHLKDVERVANKSILNLKYNLSKELMVYDTIRELNYFNTVEYDGYLSYSSLLTEYNDELIKFNEILNDTKLPSNVVNIAVDIKPKVEREYKKIIEYCNGYRDGYYSDGSFLYNTLKDYESPPYELGYDDGAKDSKYNNDYTCEEYIKHAIDMQNMWEQEINKQWLDVYK